MQQLAAEAPPRPDRELEHEQRRGDREDAVAEGLQAGGSALVHDANRGGRG